MHNHILAKKNLSLFKHTKQVATLAVIIAEKYNLDLGLSYLIACLHDIGKTHPEFQKRLISQLISDFEIPFRHEISSLFFLPLVPKEFWDDIIEGVVAHHKPIIDDYGNKGFIDLYYAYEDDFNIEYHLGDFEEWSKYALDILRALNVEDYGVCIREITREEAIESYMYVLDYIENIDFGISKYRGLLMSADHMASAVGDEFSNYIKNRKLDLSFYFGRKSDLYPLSTKEFQSEKQHTIVIAPPGAGKTDYLIKRTKGRIYYILPFQASINAMYLRLKEDLSKNNENLDIRVIHSSSRVVFQNLEYQEQLVQDKIGAEVKVLTPHQIASISLGLKNFESQMLDLAGQDVILDEIHVFNGIVRKMVISIVEVLVYLGCRVHIGTATMPTKLKDKIIEILGKDNTIITTLSTDELKTYDRHRYYKIKENQIDSILNSELVNGSKVLCVFNTVKKSQDFYEFCMMKYGEKYDIMLIHSNYKRGERANLERMLFEKYNLSEKPCIVISTQVVEVSVDIDFDCLITECCPIDSLKQRSGRICRARSWEIIKNNIIKNIYVLPPSNIPELNLPYEHDIVQKTYNSLKNGEIITDEKLQSIIDKVYENIETSGLDDISILQDGEIKIKKLYNKHKSRLIELLDINSVALILRRDIDLYKNSDKNIQSMLEIPCDINFVKKKKLTNLDAGNKPFIIEDDFYCDKKGLIKK